MSVPRLLTRIIAGAAVGGLLVSAAAVKVEAQEEEFAYDAAEAFAQRPPETEENIAAGRRLYEQKCVWCHGIDGKGNGPAALGMGERGNPKPRDFTQAQYKIRCTPSGQLPTDEDLFLVLTRGMPGTSMLAWSGLSEEERWQIVYYIKTFSDRFKKEERTPVAIGQPPMPTFENLAKGRWLYYNIECGKCHGPEGRGDGPSASGIRDALGHPLRVADLTDGETFRGGNSVVDIYRTLYTGMGGSAMPSFANTVSDRQLWYLAGYVHALSVNAPEVLALRQFWTVSPTPLAAQKEE